MPILKSNGLTIAYETAGELSGTPLLLIMGLGLQLTAWPQDFVDGLVDQGFYVIRFDNRDSGLSSKFEHAGTPNLPLTYLKTLLRWPLKSAYTLDDMAEDARGVLSALGVAKAHVVGASMGGMVAQLLAARHPQCVLTLTSIMSTSGRRGLPGPSKAARKVLMARPKKPKDPASVTDHLVATFQAIGSPAYPTPERVLRERIAVSTRRNVCVSGVARQLVAIAASGERTELLQSIGAPTLVIHGADDPLVPVACGIDTARLVPDSHLEIIEGMGHDLPAPLIERVLALIDAHTHGKMSSDSIPRLFENQ
ncbi:MAG: alpha/beta hydrolase [Pseudomonadota bacterium]